VVAVVAARAMSFDALAPHYDWLEAVLAGPLLQRCRTTWLDALAGSRAILSAGEGHGRFATACALRHPESRLHCVDASAPMLARARRRARAAGLAGRITWETAVLPGWTPPLSAFDAIVTGFFLDCFPPPMLAAVVATLAAAARPGARWLVTDFAVPAHGAARWRARAVHALMYGFFRVATRLPARRLTPPDALLTGQGFRLVGRRTFNWGLLQADWWVRS
jgi:ubiquinone/menaquinone biosynthesis C-methylase UbiE